MAGRKPLSQEEANRRIRVCRELYEEGKTKVQISETTEFSQTVVNIYLQGYRSQQHYTEELEKVRRDYQRRLESSEIKTPEYRITQVELNNRGMLLGLDSGHRDVTAHMRDCLEGTLQNSGISELGEHRFSYHYRLNGVSVHHHNLRGRAFLEAYAETVIQRQVTES